MSPGIGLMGRRISRESEAVSLAVSAVASRYGAEPGGVAALETRYHAEAGDWYVALGWEGGRAVVRMDSVLGTVTDVREV